MKVEFIDKTPLRCTLEPYYFEFFRDGKTYKVPQGFFYDWMSVFWLLKLFYVRDREIAFLRHDWWYSKACDYWTRKDWDLQLFSDLKGNWKRYPVYIGLRLFGFTSWKKDINYHRYKTIITKYEKNNKENNPN